MKAKDKELEKRVKEVLKGLQYPCGIEYMKIFTEWVGQFFVLSTFPYFLFKGENILNEVGAGSCIRCILDFHRFDNLEDISYNISIEKKTIFPATILDEWKRASEEIFDGIKGELWRGDS